MGSISREFKARIIRTEGRRFVEIPEELFLEGEQVLLLQDSDGTLLVYPAEEAAREAMYARFNPFVHWKDGTWPREAPMWDEECT